MPVRGTDFRHWLVRTFYELKGKPPGASAMADAIGVIEAKAKYDGARLEVAVRVAAHGGKLYLDLANDAWEAVEVGPAGWRVVQDVPVKFRRPRGVQPLPRPSPLGRLDDLWGFVNIVDDSARRLLVGWLVAALRNVGPYPLLSLHGEQGSGKSSASRVIRRLLDPHRVPLRCEPREPRDLAIAAGNAWVLALDNLSHLPDWLSDALCRLATGGGFGTRQLYSDDEEMLFDAMRPVLLNGIAAVATRPDLLERSLLVELPVIGEGLRRTEAQLWAEFDQAAPGILGGLLDAAAGALRRLPQVRLERLPRMADFAAWVTAAEPALAWPDGSFLSAYGRTQAEANEVALEASAISAPLLKLLDREPSATWQGTPTDLLQRLTLLAGGSAVRSRDWPVKPQVLTSQLKRLSPNLRRAGVEVGFVRSGRKRSRIIHLEKVGETASAASAASAAPESLEKQEVTSPPPADAEHPHERPRGVEERPHNRLCADGSPGVEDADAADVVSPDISKGDVDLSGAERQGGREVIEI
jgi:hypothetical protein